MDNIKSDYITLWIKDAERNDKSDLANGVACWSIPESNYFYKEKAMVTLMSVCDSTLDERLGENIVMMSPLGLNGSTTQIDSGTNDKMDDNLACLGSFVAHARFDNTQFFDITYRGTSPIELQVMSQPQEIRIHFFVNDKSTIDLSNMDAGGVAGHIVLRFKYFNQSQYEVSNSPF